MNNETGRLYISIRSDGLGERLKALLNAMVLAEVTGGDFAFHWRGMKPVDMPFHAIQNPEAMFDPAFLADHYRPDLKDGILPLSKVAADILARRPGAGEVVRVDQNVFTGEMREAPSVFDFTGRFGAAFRRIRFSSELEHARSLAEAVTLPGEPVALHLRAGDIVYGRYRFVGRYAGKLYSYPLAIRMVEDCLERGAQPIVFGQDAAFLGWLRESYGILLPADFLTEPLSVAQMALFEICLMARCRGIYAGSSGFSGVAALVSDQKVIRASRFDKPQVMIDLIETTLANGPTDPRISDLQRAMAAWTAISLDTLPPEEQLRFADMALGYDPVNFLYAMHGAALLYRQGRAEEAERRMIGNLPAGGEAMQHFLEHMTAKPFNGIVVSGPYQDTFREAADAGHPMAACCVSLAEQAFGRKAEAARYAAVFHSNRPAEASHLDEAIIPLLQSA